MQTDVSHGHPPCMVTVYLDGGQGLPRAPGPPAVLGARCTYAPSRLLGSEGIGILLLGVLRRSEAHAASSGESDSRVQPGADEPDSFPVPGSGQQGSGVPSASQWVGETVV